MLVGARINRSLLRERTISPHGGAGQPEAVGHEVPFPIPFVVNPTIGSFYRYQDFDESRSARCLHAVAELGIADALGESPRSVAELASDTGTNAETLARTLRVLSTEWIFEARDGGWVHTPGVAFAAIGSRAVYEIICPDDRFVCVLARIRILRR